MEENGVWRTIGGRRVFIKEGQSLGDAMRESGKFKVSTKRQEKQLEKRIKKYEDDEANRKKEKQKIYDEWNETEKKFSKDFKDFDAWKAAKKEVNRELGKVDNKYAYLRKEGEEIRKIQHQLYVGQEEKIKQKIFDHYVKDYEFKNTQLKEYLKDNLRTWLSYEDINKKYKKLTKAMIKMDTLMDEDGFVLSKSPYSFSLYGIPEGGEVSWGGKPLNSYRLSDHWNFESRGEVHCKLSNDDKYIEKLILAKYNGESYDIVEDYGEF